MSWNPELYHKFQSERFAPFEDLIGLIVVREGLSAIDLGCGTGELTSMLADRLPGSDVLGIDSSPEMLEQAKSKEREGLRFELRSIDDVAGEWDLVFSNAAIHWVEDHARLIPSLFALVSPGGTDRGPAPFQPQPRNADAGARSREGTPFRRCAQGVDEKIPRIVDKRLRGAPLSVRGNEH